MANPRSEVSKERQVDFEYLKSVFDVRDVFWPMTPRKAITLTTYSALLGGLFAAEFTVGFVRYLVAASRANAIPLTVFAYAFDPLDFVITMAFTKYPALPEKEIKLVDLESQEPSIPEENEDLAVVIAAHYSAEFIGETVKAFLKVVKPEQIYVIDNANEESPPDKTREVLQSINPKINYHYHPRGNKTVAHFIGALLSKQSRILFMDDDTQPSDDFRLEVELFDDTHKVIVYPIRAIRKDGKKTFVVGWTDMEFARSDMDKQFQDRFHGPLYHHGAGYACDKEFALEVFYRHTTDFIAEDMQGGLIKEALKKRACLSKHYFNTLVPTTYVGTPPNKLNQRMRVWNFGTQTMNGTVAWGFLTQWPLPGPNKTVLKAVADTSVLKYEQFKFLYSNLMDWLRPFVIAVVATDPLFWARLGGIIAVKQVLNLLFNFIHLRNRPDLRQPLSIAATKFIDDFVENIFTVLSLTRYLLVYIPNKKTLLTIPELDKLGEFDYIREMLDPGPHKFLTHARIPTRIYSGLNETLGNWEVVIKAVRTNNLGEIENTLDKAASDLSKQATKSENGAQYVALYFGALVLAMLIAKILLNVLGDPENRTHANTNMALDFTMAVVGVIGGLLTSCIIKSSLTADDLSRQAQISRNRLALFHVPEVSLPKEKEIPSLVHRGSIRR